jgi:hypothetical protein
MRSIIGLLGFLIALSGCSTTSVNLKYSPSTSVAKVSPSALPVSVGTFLDQRGNAPNWIGAVRGGFGNPIKVLESDRPVSELVRVAFLDGLRERGASVATSASAYQITGIIKRLDSSQYVRREAHVHLELTVIDPNGQQRFTRTYTADNVDGSLISVSTGVFGSIEELRAILEKTLREAVDKALDDSALRSAARL